MCSLGAGGLGGATVLEGGWGGEKRGTRSLSLAEFQLTGR